MEDKMFEKFLGGQKAIINLPGAVPAGVLIAAGTMILFYGLLGVAAAQSSEYAVVSAMKAAVNAS